LESKDETFPVFKDGMEDCAWKGAERIMVDQYDNIEKITFGTA